MRSAVGIPCIHAGEDVNPASPALSGSGGGGSGIQCVGGFARLIVTLPISSSRLQYGRGFLAYSSLSHSAIAAFRVSQVGGYTSTADPSFGAVSISCHSII